MACGPPSGLGVGGKYKQMHTHLWGIIYDIFTVLDIWNFKHYVSFVFLRPPPFEQVKQNLQILKQKIQNAK